MTAVKDNLVIEAREFTEETYRRIFEDCPLSMAIASIDLRFVKANNAFCQMTGYSQQELTSLTIRDITHPDDLAATIEFTNKLLSGQISAYRIEKRYLRKNGDVLWASVYISAIHDENGRFLHFLGMIEDINERKQAEIKLNHINEELKENDKLKNEFIFTVSHELRTPLCVFKNIISNAMAGIMGPISQKLRKNMEMADQNIDRLSRIVNDFLDIAKIEAGKVRLDVGQVNIRSVIREVVEEFTSITASKNATLDMVAPDTDILIEGDRDKLVQVLTNLLGNAAKFIQTGGHILVTLSEYADHVSVSVHDDGPGIEPIYLDKIFERFGLGAPSTRSGHPSTGLGLNISKKIIEMHNGRIWAESTFGRGSTFTFVLPTKQPVRK